MFGKLKDWRRVATRYDRCAHTFFSAICDVLRRVADFGIQHYSMSHHPWVVAEPFTLEPCESYSKADIDEYVAVLRQISKEAYEDPKFVKNAPHRSVIHNIPLPSATDPERITVTWRQYKRKKRARAAGKT
jgi:glycine dehydrogenase subunit 2